MFRDILSHIRMNTPTHAQLQLLQSRVFTSQAQNALPHIPIDACIVGPTNDVVDAYSELQLFKYFQTTQITRMLVGMWFGCGWLRLAS